MSEISKKIKLVNLIYERVSKVYDAVDVETGENVVVKKVSLQEEYNGFPSTTLRQIVLLRQLNHPNIVTLRNTLFDKENIYLVYDKMFTNLATFIYRSKKISPMLIKSYAFQILCGIAYLHSKGILHRRIQPDNCLINKDGFLKICGFSSARPYSIPESLITPEVTSTNYMAPEQLLYSSNYGTPNDIWGAACVIGEMLTNSPIFPGDSLIDQIMKIFKVIGTPTEENWPGYMDLPGYSPISHLKTMEKIDLKTFFHTDDELLIDLMEQMLTPNPSKRISAIDAIQHPYFDSLPPMLVELCTPKFEE